MIPAELMDGLCALVLEVLPTKERLEEALARAFDDVVREYHVTGLRITEGRHVIDAVLWEDGRRPVVRDVLQELEERELLGTDWFDELRAAAPGRTEEIDRLEQRIAEEIERNRGKGVPPTPVEPSDPVEPEPDPPTTGQAGPWVAIAAAGVIVVVLVIVVGMVWMQMDRTGGTNVSTDTGDTKDTGRGTRESDTDPDTRSMLGTHRETPEISAVFDVDWVVPLTRTCGTNERAQWGLMVDVATVATVGKPGTACTWKDEDGVAWAQTRAEDGVVLLRPALQRVLRSIGTLETTESTTTTPGVDRTRITGGATSSESVRTLRTPIRATELSTTEVPPIERPPTLEGVKLTAAQRASLMKRMESLDLATLEARLADQEWAMNRELTVFRSSDMPTVIKASQILSNRPVFQAMSTDDPALKLSTYLGTKDVPLDRNDDGALMLPGGQDRCDGAPVITPSKTVAGLCRNRADGVVVVPIGADKVAGSLQAEGVVVFLVQ